VATPVISVVVPTRNRRGSLTRLLDVLAADAAHSPDFEVIVVDDGSTDDTVSSIRNAPWPFPLRVLEQHGSGAAIARNAGARAASGEILLFLDDDVEPQGRLLAAHAAIHAASSDVVGLGDLPPVAGDTFLGVMLRAWWEAMLSGVRRPGHRFSYRDLLSGHLSLRRAQFERLRGFDESLCCREDYEFGTRAIAAGLLLIFVPEAVARHHDSTDLAKTFGRKFEEGRADVQLLRRHPPLGPSLPLAWTGERPRLERALIRLAWTAPVCGDAAVTVITRLLPLFERLKLRWRWRGLLDSVLSYWYWRGVAKAVESRNALEAMLAAGAAQEAPVTIDLANGVEAAEERLEAERPRSARLMFGDRTIGIVPDVPGSEPLRREHLRAILGDDLRQQYLRVLIAAGIAPAQLVAAAPLPAGPDGDDTHNAVAA